MIDVRDKKVLVVGIARSGVAAARLLVAHGAMVMANDIKTEGQLGAEVQELGKLGVMFSLGGHPESLFVNAGLIVLSPGVPADIAPLDAARRAGVEIISEPELAGRFLRGRMIGGVFVIEMLSVVLQVASFKLFRRRIFKMAPLHHHFELLYPPELSRRMEPKIVFRFLIIAILFALLSLSTLKLR